MAAPRPSWKNRRRVVIVTLLYCATVVGWLVLHGASTQLNESIANGLILLAGGVIGSYVFGAAWDDLNVMRNLGGGAFAGQERPPGYPADIVPPEKSE